MKVYEVVFNEDTGEGVFAISLVDSPAIESDFIYLNKEGAPHKMQLKTADEERQLVTGLVLVPDKAIYRNQGGEEFYITFPRKTIETLAHAYLKRGRQRDTTVQHAVRVDGVTLVESWVTTEGDKKLSALGINSPAGAWAGTMKVDNKKLWDEYIKTGELAGFSVEGFFDLSDTGTELAEQIPEPLGVGQTVDAIMDLINEYEA